MVKTSLKINGNKVMLIDDSNVYHCYMDQLDQKRENAQYQGYQNPCWCKEWLLQIPMATTTMTPIGFELDSHILFYQSILKDTLE